MKYRVDFTNMILWEDAHYVVINKPPYLSTLEDRLEKENLLLMARKTIPDAQVCHRLDKDTSGILIIAKDPDAYRHMSLQFERRTVTKIYHAVVDGLHKFENLRVDKPILKMDDGTVKIARGGKPSETYFTSLHSYRMHTLVECRPVTGRTHQIRIHLTVVNAPITGDTLYGGKPFYLSSVKRGFNLKKFTDEEPLMKRMALHAYSIHFLDLKGNPVKIEAPYPKDFQALVRQLELNA